MKKTLAVLALSAAFAVPASAGSMHGGDWADLIAVVVSGVAAAAVAANTPPPVPVVIEPAPQPAVVVEAPPAPVYAAPVVPGTITTSIIDRKGNRICVYSNGETYPIPKWLKCDFYAWEAKQQYDWEIENGRR